MVTTILVGIVAFVVGAGVGSKYASKVAADEAAGLALVNKLKADL